MTDLEAERLERLEGALGRELEEGGVVCAGEGPVEGQAGDVLDGEVGGGGVADLDEAKVQARLLHERLGALDVRFDAQEDGLGGELDVARYEVGEFAGLRARYERVHQGVAFGRLVFLGEKKVDFKYICYSEST